MKQNERQATWRRLAITFADTQPAVVAVPVRVNPVEARTVDLPKMGSATTGWAR